MRDWNNTMETVICLSVENMFSPCNQILIWEKNMFHTHAKRGNWPCCGTHSANKTPFDKVSCQYFKSTYYMAFIYNAFSLKNCSNLNPQTPALKQTPYPADVQLQGLPWLASIYTLHVTVTCVSQCWKTHQWMNLKWKLFSSSFASPCASLHGTCLWCFIYGGGTAEQFEHLKKDQTKLSGWDEMII